MVIDTRLYSRANKEGKKGKSAEKAQLEKLDEKFAAEISELTKRLVAKLWTLLQGKATTGITDYFGVELYPAGTKFSQKLLEEIARKSTDEKTGVVMGYLNLGSCKWTGDAHTDALIEATINNYTIEWKKADAVIKREKYNITNGDELPQTGVIQMANMFGYATDLRSSTQGRGQYSMEPHSYVEIPKSIAEKIIAERGRKDD